MLEAWLLWARREIHLGCDESLDLPESVRATIRVGS